MPLEILGQMENFIMVVEHLTMEIGEYGYESGAGIRLRLVQKSGGLINNFDTTWAYIVFQIRL